VTSTNTTEEEAVCICKVAKEEVNVKKTKLKRSSECVREFSRRKAAYPRCAGTGVKIKSSSRWRELLAEYHYPCVLSHSGFQGAETMGKRSRGEAVRERNCIAMRFRVAGEERKL